MRDFCIKKRQICGDLAYTNSAEWLRFLAAMAATVDLLFGLHQLHLSQAKTSVATQPRAQPTLVFTLFSSLGLPHKSDATQQHERHESQQQAPEPPGNTAVQKE